MSGLAVGDRRWYVISGIGAMRPIWAEAVVVRVTSSRVGVRAAVGSLRARYVTISRLMVGPPPPDVLTLTFPTRAQCQPQRSAYAVH